MANGKDVDKCWRFDPLQLGEGEGELCSVRLVVADAVCCFHLNPDDGFFIVPNNKDVIPRIDEWNRDVDTAVQKLGHHGQLAAASREMRLHRGWSGCLLPRSTHARAAGWRLSAGRVESFVGRLLSLT